MAEHQRRRRRIAAQPTTSAAGEAPPTIEDTDDELERLEARVEALRAQKAASTAPAPPREEMRTEAMRGEMRGETSREEAERIAAEFLERNKYKNPDFHDDYDLRQLGISEPDGWEYHWKRRLAGGMEDPGYQVQLLNAGWRYVPAQRHPELIPPKGIFEIIERNGLVLMECPRVLCDRARALDQRRAFDRLEINRQRLGGPTALGPATNGRSSTAPPEVRLSYEQMPKGAKPRGAAGVAMPVPDA